MSTVLEISNRAHLQAVRDGANSETIDVLAQASIEAARQEIQTRPQTRREQRKPRAKDTKLPRTEPTQ